MTRERIAGFMLGISVGTVIGFYLRPPDEHNKTTNLAGLRERKGVPARPSTSDTRWRPREVARSLTNRR